MQLTDTHTHLTMSEYEGKVDDLLQRSRQAGVDRWITIGTNPADSEAGIELCRKYDRMYCTVGIHPHEAGKAEAEYVEELERRAGEKKVCGIGEIGLDFHYDFSERGVQRKVFEEQLELAGKLGKPIVIHCRKAFEDCLGILREWGQDNALVVFHCFSGGKSEAKTVMDRGYWLSFPGIITFKNARETQEVAKYVPLEKVMLETDCPYLSPEPKRTVRPNEPALLVHIAEKLAQLRKVGVEEIAQTTTANAEFFFKLDSSG